MRGEIITGIVATGIGQGQHFTRLDWARKKFIELVAIDPYPGTLNVTVTDQVARDVWDRLTATPGLIMENPNDGPHDCDARCYQILVGGRIDGAIVVPEVASYPEDAIELIAAVNVRQALNLNDGDPLLLEIK